MNFLKNHWPILVLTVISSIIFSSITFVNHYNFRTYALDLGLYTNAAYKYAHFLLADSGMIKDYHELLLGGHFDLYLILFSPLTYLFGSYTLLIVQLISILMGGIGVYSYFCLFHEKDKTIPALSALYFFCFFGVIGAISFDYHSVVVASCMVPWFFISIHKNQKLLSILLALLMVISQENFSLFLSFICIGLIMEWKKERDKLLLLSSLSAFCLLYFVFIIYWVIPCFSAENLYGGLHYSFLGNSFFNALKILFLHPLDCFIALFKNHLPIEALDDIKWETHFILALSGIPLLLKKPQYLVMLLPIYFQKFYHDNFFLWGIGGQYNIEFAPILAIAIFSICSDLKNKIIGASIGLLLICLESKASYRTMTNTIIYTDKTRINFFSKEHYTSLFDVASVNQQLSTIPKTANISAQNSLVPHLCLRENIYQFPIIKNAEYIIYSEKESTYPINKEDFDTKIRELLKSGVWDISTKNNLTILKHK